MPETLPIHLFRSFDLIFKNDFPLNPPIAGNHFIPAGSYTLVQEGSNPNAYGVYALGNTSGTKLANVGVIIVEEGGVVVAKVS